MDLRRFVPEAAIEAGMEAYAPVVKVESWFVS
jgi:hypothetical protein